MVIRDTTTSSMIGHVVLELTQLSEEDLPLVVEFVDYLKRKRQVEPQHRLSVAEMRAEARRRVGRLRKVPRDEIVARFRELTEEIRQEAVAKGTAIEGDWCAD